MDKVKKPLYKLSEAQREAVETIHGPVMLVSCPGSGKTTVIVNRTLHMIKTGIKPESILVLTFSRMAAGEMKERFLKQYEGRRIPCFSTIHAFCYHLLTRYTRLTLIDSWQQTELLNESIRHMWQQGIHDTDIKSMNQFASSFLLEYGTVKNNREDPKRHKSDMMSDDEFMYLYNRYEMLKDEKGLIDYDDMLHKGYELLTAKQGLLEELRASYRYIMVDEYQDVNYIQRDLIYLIAGPDTNANLFVVGDDDQSIYRFRGARPEIMLAFPKEYPSCRTIYMDTNYRCAPEILLPARCLIENNRLRFKKNIRASKGNGGYTELKMHKGTWAEAQYVACKIEELIRSGYAYSDIAVLYRNNQQASLIAKMLKDKHIPFVSKEQLKNPYKEPILGALVSYLHICDGTWGMKDLLSVLNKPYRNINPDILKGCVPVASDILEKTEKYPHVYDKIRKLFEQLNGIHRLPVCEQIVSIRLNTGLDRYAQHLERSMELPEGSILTLLDIYCEDARSCSCLEEYIQILKQQAYMYDKVSKEKNRNAVCLSTMHGSKGLEFSNVFVISGNESVIPGNGKTGSEIEEERRLYYVAVTRAKENLFLSTTLRRNGEKDISRFIYEFYQKKPVIKEIKKKSSHFKWKKGMRFTMEGMGAGMVMLIKPHEMLVLPDSETVPVWIQEEKYREMEPVIRTMM